MNPRLVFPCLLPALMVLVSCTSESSSTDRAAPGTTPAAPALEAPVAATVIDFGPGGIALGHAATFVGSANCGECHAELVEQQQSHHMAQTGRRVTAAIRQRWFSPQSLEKPIDWPDTEGTRAPRYRSEVAGVFLEGRDRQGVVQRARVAAVIGSGNNGMTPISTGPNRGIRELRVSFFTRLDRWLLTPGDAGDPDLLGYVRSPEASMDCLRCHATLLRWKDDRLDAEASVFGIGCERCHGPGSAHAKVAFDGGSSFNIFNPGSLRGADQVRFCGRCHRVPSAVEPHHVLKAAPRIARHAGVSLMLSKCYRASPPESVLTCVECHDPHRNIDPTRDDFNRPCRRCHASPAADHTTAVSASSDCVSCHMQREKRGFFGLEFTSHWIRVPGSPPPATSPERGEYVRYLESSYREAIATPGTGPERQSKLRMRLGKLLYQEGDPEAGLEMIRGALTFEPLYKDRIIAAEYHRRDRKYDDAVAILQEAIRTAPGNNRAYRDLARIHIAAGRSDTAARTLDAWGRALPGDPHIEQMRRALKRRP